MNPSQAISREFLQQSIDAEIKSLEESLRVLKYRRNALSPVSSLHPELFAAIFSILCLPGTSSQDGKPVDYHLARLRVSHVCHQWREITLNLPLLWSYVNFTSKSLSSVGIAETLVRAKLAPLRFEANFPGHLWDHDRSHTFQKALHTHAPHIRHLQISADDVLLHDILEGLRVVSPVLTLKHLSLSSITTEKRGRIWASIPDTLFNSSTPKLSRLKLDNCNISWRSPLFKGLKYLEILNPSVNARPELTVWLAALDEMPQLTTLTLRSASPIAPPFPFVVSYTVTLPSLKSLNIFASPRDCALALAHLDLPALTSLCITSFSSHSLSKSDVQKLLPFIARHAYGPQDTQPLQSVLIRSEEHRVDILAWPVSDIGVEMHDLPTLLTETLPTRVALSFRSDGWSGPRNRLEILEMVMASLPLDGLVMLDAHDLSYSELEQGLQTQHFWNHLSPMWPQLQCVRLAPAAAHGFIEMVLEDNGGGKKPLLPSLTQLVMLKFSLRSLPLLPLRNALMKRVKEGVPVKVLDLRMCGIADNRAEDWLQSLSDIVVDVLHPNLGERR